MTFLEWFPDITDMIGVWITSLFSALSHSPVLSLVIAVALLWAISSIILFFIGRSSSSGSGSGSGSASRPKKNINSKKE